MTGKKISLVGVFLWAGLALALLALLVAGLFSDGGFLSSGGGSWFNFFWWEDEDMGEANLRQNETFSLAGITRIEISGVEHTVNIAVTDGAGVVIREYATAGIADSQLCRIESRGGAITVETPNRPFNLRFRRRRLEIELPRAYAEALRAASVSGTVTLYGDTDVKSLELSSVSGSVKVPGRVTAESVRMETTSGSVEAGELETGRYAFSTVSGSVRVLSLTGGGTAHSVSGSIHLAFRRFDGDCAADTVSGSVRLTLPGDSAFFYNLSSVSGGIEGDGFSLSVSGKVGKSASGAVGGVPTHTVRAETVSGSIRIAAD